MDTSADWNTMAGTRSQEEKAVEQAMIIETARTWRMRLIIPLTCAMLSPWAWAQAGNSTSQTSNTGAGTPVAPKTSNDPGPVAQGKPHDDSFVIGADDVLAISVWKEPDVSRVVPVRSDGKISLPLAGEVQAGGTTPRQLEKAIAAKLQSYISEPEVTVIVQQINSQKFNILGLVAKPGAYPLTNGATVLDAIALAGGFRDFAKQKSIYVLRQSPDGSQTRIPFNYKDVIKGKNVEQNIKLQPRDTVVVP
jgi:polysaccharide export outer membrane protein